MVRKYRANDAKSQTLRNMPYLRVNGLLLNELKRAGQAKDVDSARRRVQDVLADSHELATDSIRNEIDRLPASAASDLWRRYFSGRARPRRLHQALIERYLGNVKARYRDFQDVVATLSTLNDVNHLVRDIERRTRPSPKDRHGRGFLLSWIAARTHEETGPLDRGGPNVDLYRPDESSPVPPRNAGAPSSGDPTSLLRRFAPIIVQERWENARYEPDSDEIGTIRLAGSPGDVRVVVDTSSPSIYAYWQYTVINNRKHVQLIYVYWYPRHPALRPGDPEAGDVDGAMLRITLDSANRPAIFETVLNCGCYHRCYPSGALEARTAAEYGSPLSGKKYCIERTMLGSLDWIVPETVDVPMTGDVRPILFARAGFHGPAGISFDAGSPSESKRNLLHHRAYALRPYDELEHMEVGDGYGSMFGADGLVHHAGRLEGWLLAPTGMLSAGQPRQRGTHRIHWDQYDFDDPHLLEKCLRLPSDF